MTANTSVLAADPAVPYREHLLDPVVVARLVSETLGRGRIAMRSCRLHSVAYRPGKRLRAVYRVDADGRELHVGAATFRSDKRGLRAYAHAIASARTTGPVLPVGYDADHLTMFWTFPNDRRIENLPAVMDARDEVAGLLSGRWVRSRLVDYGPEVSAVIGCLDDADRLIAYAKVRAGDDGEDEHRTQAELARRAAGSRLRIARPLAYSPRYRTLLVEPIVGTSIGELVDARRLGGVRAYGAALARLHTVPTGGLVANGRDTLSRLQHRADGIRLARPDLADQISSILGELEQRWDDARGMRVPVHGDTNENNAILQGDTVALIDFERASVGAAGSDLGNYLGLQRYYRSIGFISPDEERARVAAFLGGYASVNPLPQREMLRVHESAGVLGRAFRAVTRLRPYAVPFMSDLVAEARGLLR